MMDKLRNLPHSTSNSYLVVDGGLGTQLTSAFGHHEIDSDPLWTARLLQTNHAHIKSVHRQFLDAGADIITTASYQANVSNLRQHMNITDDAAKDLISLSAQLAIEARNEFWDEFSCWQGSSESRVRPLVAGSVGPYGACLADRSEYDGNYVDSMQEQELEDWHRARIECLIAAGVDLLACETIPALKEAACIATLLQKLPQAPPAWISFACKDDLHTCHGEKFSDAVSAIGKKTECLVAIGINCTPPQFVSKLLASAQDQATLPFVVYPNKGDRWMADKSWSKMDRNDKPLPLDEYCEEWLKLGTKIFGGCCCIYPPDIRRISETLKQLSGGSPAKCCGGTI